MPRHKGISAARKKGKLGTATKPRRVPTETDEAGAKKPAATERSAAEVDRLAEQIVLVNVFLARWILLMRRAGGTSTT